MYHIQALLFLQELMAPNQYNEKKVGVLCYVSFPIFLDLLKRCLPIDDHINIWQLSPQLN